TYRASANDLGPYGILKVAPNVTLRGEGLTPPRIVLDSAATESSLVLGQGATASRLELEGGGTTEVPLRVGRSAQVHQLVVVNNQAKRGIACLIEPLGGTTRVTDTACVSNAMESAALETGGVESPAGSTTTLELRNVTAYANVAKSQGMFSS